MNNRFLAIAISAGLAIIPGIGSAADTSGFFINGSVGQSNLDKSDSNIKLYDDSDTAYIANFGYRWAVSPSVLLGVEGGYTDLGSFKANTLQPAETSISGWSVGANGHFNVTDNWYISGRLGLFRGKVETDAGLVNVSHTGNKMYAGAGFGYDFNNNFSVGLNYDRYQTSAYGEKLTPDMFSVSGEYRF